MQKAASMASMLVLFLVLNCANIWALARANEGEGGQRGQPAEDGGRGPRVRGTTSPWFQISQISKCPKVTVILSHWEALGEVSKLRYKSLLYFSSNGSYCISY